MVSFCGYIQLLNDGDTVVMASVKLFQSVIVIGSFVVKKTRGSCEFSVISFQTAELRKPGIECRGAEVQECGRTRRLLLVTIRVENC